MNTAWARRTLLIVATLCLASSRVAAGHIAALSQPDLLDCSGSPHVVIRESVSFTAPRLCRVSSLRITSTGSLNILGNLTLEAREGIVLEKGGRLHATSHVKINKEFSPTTQSGAGGSHAGAGQGQPRNVTQGHGSLVRPVEFGGSTNRDAVGGGAISLSAAYVLIDGHVSVVGGTPALMKGSCLPQGGGAGGSILITSLSVVNGSGVLDASGGDGNDCGGGGGSAGRVAVHSHQIGPLLTFRTRAGHGTSESVATTKAAAGTVYLANITGTHLFISAHLDAGLASPAFVLDKELLLTSLHLNDGGHLLINKGADVSLTEQLVGDCSLRIVVRGRLAVKHSSGTLPVQLAVESSGELAWEGPINAASRACTLNVLGRFSMGPLRLGNSVQATIQVPEPHTLGRREVLEGTQSGPLQVESLTINAGSSLSVVGGDLSVATHVTMLPRSTLVLSHNLVSGGSIEIGEGASVSAAGNITAHGPVDIQGVSAGAVVTMQGVTEIVSNTSIAVGPLAVVDAVMVSGSGPSPGSANGGGGGHAGPGGASAGGLQYGDYAYPRETGSSGGSNSLASGFAVRGGGAVRLRAPSVTNFGTVRANGATGVTAKSPSRVTRRRYLSYTVTYASGAGSGGSVLVEADTLFGTGLYSADGGSTYSTTATASGTGEVLTQAGGGSGGHVSLLVGSLDAGYTENTKASAGSGPGGGGGAGTRYISVAGGYKRLVMSGTASNQETTVLTRVVDHAQAQVPRNLSADITELDLSGSIRASIRAVDFLSLTEVQPTAHLSTTAASRCTAVLYVDGALQLPSNLGGLYFSTTVGATGTVSWPPPYPAVTTSPCECPPKRSGTLCTSVAPCTGGTFTTQASLDSALSGCLTVSTSIVIAPASPESVYSLVSLASLASIAGTLTVQATSAVSLDLSSLTTVGGLHIVANELLTTFSGGLSTVSGDMVIAGNTALLQLPDSLVSISGMLVIFNNGALQTISSLSSLTSTGPLQITNNVLLASLYGLRNIAQIAGPLSIEQNSVNMTACPVLVQSLLQATQGSTSGTVTIYGTSPVSAGIHLSQDYVCANGGTCSDSEQGSVCLCPFEYTGTFCEVFISDCLSAPCTNAGTCVPNANGYSCVCPESRGGERCEACAPHFYTAECVPCSGQCLNGECDDGVVGSGDCLACPSNFYSTACIGCNCNGNGDCDDGVAGLGTCTCFPGWTGTSCETPLASCTRAPCLNGATCFDGGSTTNFFCSCSTGYQGLQCEHDIDECVENVETLPCLANVNECLNVNGTFNCVCSSGTFGPAGVAAAATTCTSCSLCTGTTTAQVCDPVSGSCICEVGYTGVACDQLAAGVCPPRTTQQSPNSVPVGVGCARGQLGDECTDTCFFGFERTSGTGVATCSVGGWSVPEGSCITPCPSVPPPENGAGTCVETASVSLQCVQSCQPGYQVVGTAARNCTDGIWSGTAVSCIAIDECASSPCQNGGLCTDSHLTVSCDCTGTGFLGDLCETPEPLPCDSSPCVNGGACQPLSTDKFSCDCSRTGAVGSLCETLVDECASSPCNNAGSCIDGLFSFACNCSATGFDGELCDAPINECASSPCQNGGECTDGPWGYTCACPPGFAGAQCSSNPFNCLSSPCAPRATCIEGVDSFVCDCPTGTTGVLCTLDIDECASSPCQNGATCFDLAGEASYTCACPAGQTGSLCEVTLHCESAPCLNAGTCTESLGGALCACNVLYTGDRCEFAIDLCESSPCVGVGASCVFLPPSFFTCRCGADRTGVTCESTVNQCASSPCENGATCEDGTDAFVCICLDGYEGITCSNELLECASMPCLNGGTCVDALNAYSCLCADGFAGDTCESNVDECASTPCLNGGTCVDALNAYFCLCADGSAGVTCESNVDECASMPCLNGGTCVDALNAYSCLCADGFAGVTCESNVDECASMPCVNGGTCADGVNGFACVCTSAFTGVNCVDDVDECVSFPCSNGATCVDSADAFFCLCATGFTGTLCEIDIDECSSSPCLNMGTCVDAVGSFLCLCHSGFTGTLCDSEVDECASMPCLHGATCVDAVDEYACVCSDSHTGAMCETVLDGCASSPCANFGTCTSLVSGGFSCACVASYGGPECTTLLNANLCAMALLDGAQEEYLNGDTGAGPCAGTGAYITVGAGSLAAPTVVQMILVDPLDASLSAAPAGTSLRATSYVRVEPAGSVFTLPFVKFRLSVSGTLSADEWSRLVMFSSSAGGDFVEVASTRRNISGGYIEGELHHLSVMVGFVGTPANGEASSNLPIYAGGGAVLLVIVIVICLIAFVVLKRRRRTLKFSGLPRERQSSASTDLEMRSLGSPEEDSVAMSQTINPLVFGRRRAGSQLIAEGEEGAEEKRVFRFSGEQRALRGESDDTDSLRPASYMNSMNGSRKESESETKRNLGNRALLAQEEKDYAMLAEPYVGILPTTVERDGARHAWSLSRPGDEGASKVYLDLADEIDDDKDYLQYESGYTEDYSGSHSYGNAEGKNYESGAERDVTYGNAPHKDYTPIEILNTAEDERQRHRGVFSGVLEGPTGTWGGLGDDDDDKECLDNCLVGHQFSRASLAFVAEVGKGNFGFVLKATCRPLNEGGSTSTVGVKTLNANASDKDRTDFIEEASVLAALHHPNVLSLMGVCMEREPWLIVTAFAEYGDLRSFLRKVHQTRESFSLRKSEQLLIALHIIEGLNYIHSQGYIHRDLAARNCLVFDQGLIKIADFGLAVKTEGNDTEVKVVRGTQLPVRWTAVEVLVNGSHWFPSDVWSYGVIVWEIYTQGVQRPFGKVPTPGVPTLLTEGGRLTRPPKISSALWAIVTSCWDESPEGRPSPATLALFLKEMHRKAVSHEAETARNFPVYLTASSRKSLAPRGESDM